MTLTELEQAPAKAKKFPIVELFGPTIQGEGALAGTTSHFVRLGGCDFRCAWCDSSHAVLPEEVRANSTKMDAETIAAEVRKLTKADWVTLSGGNPAMHNLGELVDELAVDFMVAVETQGTMWKPWLGRVDMLTVSPKPPSSNMMMKTLGALPDFMLKALTQHAPSTICLKVPCHDEADVNFAAGIHSTYPEVPFYVSVVTEMGGLNGEFADGHRDTLEDILERWREVIGMVLDRPGEFDGVKIIPQLHALLWGHDRGH